MDFIDTHSLTMRDIIFYYCGHGDYLPGQTFYLALRTTRNAQKATTGLKPYDLRQDLDTRLADKRVYLIFDCCYASAASGVFMSGEADHSVRERIAEGFPAYGTALFAAAPRDMAALAPEGEEYTMFTGALASVIRDGAPGYDRRLSLQNLKAAVRHRISERFGILAVYPELHVPRQKAGDISALPLFLNKAPTPEKGRERLKPDPEAPSDIEAAITTAGEQLKSESVSFRKTAVAELARLYSLTPSEAMHLRIKGLLEDADDDDSRSVQDEVKKYLLQISQIEQRGASAHAAQRKSRETPRLHKPERLIHTFPAYRKAVTAVAFSPQSHLILSGSEDKSIKLWHAEGDWEKPYLENGKGAGLKVRVGKVSSVAFSPDGNLMAVGGKGGVSAGVALVNTTNNQEKPTSFRHGGSRFISHLLFLLIFGIPQLFWTVFMWIVCIPVALLGRGKVFDWADKTITDVGKTWGWVFWGLAEKWVTSIAFSPDGEFLLTSYDDDAFYLHEAAKAKKIRSFGESINCVAYSHDGRFALAGGADRKVELWSIATGEKVSALETDTWWPKRGVDTVAFSRDGRLAASGGRLHRIIVLWDMTARKQMFFLEGHDGGVTSVAFSPDGRYLLSGSLDGTLKFWETETGKEMLTIPAHTFPVRSVAISPNGRFAVSGGDDKMLKLWDLSGL
jgi:WD40 repeat protein